MISPICLIVCVLNMTLVVLSYYDCKLSFLLGFTGTRYSLKFPVFRLSGAPCQEKDDHQQEGNSDGMTRYFQWLMHREVVEF
jgi:hypothetical protein